MEKKKITLKIKDGDPLIVERELLTKDSRVFKNLIDELHFFELEMDDFETVSVKLFLQFLEDKKIEEVEAHLEVRFRELNKMSVVFKVEWLEEECRKFLRNKTREGMEENLKVFVFEECLFILRKWGKRDMINAFISDLAFEDNSVLISKYLDDLDKLDQFQISALLELGGSNSELFLKNILQNVTTKNALSENAIYLLQKMDFLFNDADNDLYTELLDTASKLPDLSLETMKLVLQLTADTMKTANSVSKKKKKSDENTVIKDGLEILLFNIETDPLKGITDLLSDGKIWSMYVVVEHLLLICCKYAPSNKESQIFITALENIVSCKEVRKVSYKYLDLCISVLSLSRLREKVNLIELLEMIRKNKKLATYNESILLRQDRTIEVVRGKHDKLVFTYKHPGISTCTMSGQCGFIVDRFTQFYNGIHSWKEQLSVNDEDYNETGVHYHNVITARDLYTYTLQFGTAHGSDVWVPGSPLYWKQRWLPRIKWGQKSDSYYHNVSCDITGYTVAKHD